MFDKIEEMIEARFTRDNCIHKYDDNEVYITDAISEMLSAESAVKEYSIDMDTVFENPGCELSYLSIALICDGKLEHNVYIVEEY